MNKTIKTINLLNKRANGEKLPQKIKYLDEYYTLYEEAESIENLYLLDGVRVGWFNHANFRLNTAVEIIEEQEKIDIPKLEILGEYENFENYDCRDIGIAFNKINQICRRINKLIDLYQENKSRIQQLDKNIKEK